MIDLKLVLVVLLCFGVSILIASLGIRAHDAIYDRGFTDGTAQTIQLDTIYVTPDTIDLGELQAFGVRCYYMRDDE